MAESITIASRSARVLATIVIAIAGVSIVFAFIEGGLALWNVPPLAFIGLVAWSVYWWPAVVVSYESITMRNVLRTIEVPWTAVERVEARPSLAVVAGGRTYRAWTGTTPGSRPRRDGLNAAPSMPGSTRLIESLKAREEAAGVAQNDRVGRAGEAGTVAEKRWQEIQAEGLLDDMPVREVRVRWHVATIVALLALIAVTIFATVQL